MLKLCDFAATPDFDRRIESRCGLARTLNVEFTDDVAPHALPGFIEQAAVDWAGSPVRVWISQLFDDRPEAQGTKLTTLCLMLGVLNLAAWIWALAEFGNQPALLGTALLAYVFGLRHAVDANHIAAIDNVVRKLMQEGKRPLTAGFFFSLGHSTVVVIAMIAVAIAAAALQRQFGTFKSVGGIIGTSVSAIFPLVIGFINLMILGARGGKHSRKSAPVGNSKSSTWTLCLQGEDFSPGCFGVLSP